MSRNLTYDSFGLWGSGSVALFGTSFIHKNPTPFTRSNAGALGATFLGCVGIAGVASGVYWYCNMDSRKKLNICNFVY